MTENWCELWRQDYSTFSEGDWYLEHKVLDPRVAQLIIDAAGWGTRYEIRGLPPAEPEIPEWARLSFEEFDAQYIVVYGTPVLRTSPEGRRAAKDAVRAQVIADRAMVEKLEKYGRKGRKLP